jgi:Zn-finger nucleic acid-binding protein
MKTRGVTAGDRLVMVDLCEDGCAGIWLDDSDMTTGLDATDDLQQVIVTRSCTPDCDQPAACPICKEPMQRYRWNYTSHVTLDQCPAGHGTWIDGGEVQAMEEFEEKDCLPAGEQAKLRARLGMDRLELEADHNRGVGEHPSRLYTLVDLVWRRFL